MGKFATTMLGLSVLSALAGPAQAAGRTQFQPTSNWVLDYADERCSLNRRFEADGKWLQMRIDSFGSPVAYRLLIFGNAVPGSSSPVPVGVTKLRFTPDAKPRETTALLGRYQGEPALSVSTAFKAAEPPAPRRLSREQQRVRGREPRAPDPAFEARTDALELDFWTLRKVTLNTGNMAEPLKAMRACLDDLKQSWGLDPAREAALTQLVVPKPETLREVTRGYPPSKALAGANAYVPVRVMIDAAGKPTACVVQNPDADEMFRKAVCEGLSNEYEPAIDAAGQPVASVFQTSVIYVASPFG